MKNTKRSKGFLIGITLTIALGVLAGCAANSKTNEDTSNGEIKVGFFPNITHAQALVGQANGDFQKAIGDKNKIIWKQFNAGPAEVEALFSGDLDIAFIGPGPAINAFVKSKGDVQIISGATTGGALLVTGSEVIAGRVAELSGKKVAVPQFGNTQDLTLRKLLADNGLKDTTKGGTVSIVQASNSDIVTLLANKQIDAALVPEPWGSQLIKKDGAKVLLDSKELFNGESYATAVVVVRTEFLKAHPDLVKSFVKAEVDVTKYINSNLKAAKKIINDEINTLTNKSLSSEILDNSFERIIVTSNPEIDSINNFAELSVETGFLKSKPELKNLYNLTYLNAALKAVGEEEIK